MAYTPSADGATVSFGSGTTFLVDQNNHSFAYLPNGSNTASELLMDGTNTGAGSTQKTLKKYRGAVYSTDGTSWWQIFVNSGGTAFFIPVGTGAGLFLAPTPPGTTVTQPNNGIIDANLDVWCWGSASVHGKVITKNGTNIAGTDAVLMYWDGTTLYYKDGVPAWHSWNGSSFVSASDPTTAVPGSPINLTSPSQAGTSVTLSFALPLPSGGPLDNGSVTVQYKAHSSGTWLTSQTIPYCTPGSGTFTDTHSNTWSINSSNHPVINGTVTDTASNCTMLMLVAGVVTQIDTAGNYYSTTPTGTISSAPSWAGPSATSPLTAVVVGSLTAGTSYDFQVNVSNTHGASAYTSTYTVSTASTGPGPSASSAFITADFTVPVNYVSPGSGQQIVSPRLWGVADGAAADDGRFGARGNNTNNNSFCAFTATTYLTPAGTINPGLWVFIGNTAFSPTNPWFTGTSVNTSAFANLLAGFPSVDTLGISGIIFGLDFTFGNVTDYGTAMGNLASYFYNGGAGRNMSNGHPLPVIGFTGHNEPDIAGHYTRSQIAAYYGALKTAVKSVNPNYLVVGPQPSWWNGNDGGIDGFMSDVPGMDGISWDGFPQGSGQTIGSGLWTNTDYKDAFGGAVTDVITKLQYTPSVMLQMGAIDSACADPDGSDYHGAVWKAIQQIEQLNAAPVPMYCGHWDSFLQGTSGLIDGNMNITPTGYLVARGVRKVTGSRWAVTTNSAGLLICTTSPGPGKATMMVVNAGQGAQNSKTVAFSKWPVNSTGNATMDTWQLTSSTTGDGTTGTVAVTSGVTAAMNFPDPSVTIISI